MLFAFYGWGEGNTGVLTSLSLNILTHFHSPYSFSGIFSLLLHKNAFLLLFHKNSHLSLLINRK